MKKIKWEDQEFTRDEFLENLALRIKGNASANGVREAIGEAEQILDEDGESILEELTKDYDCIYCMNCTVYHELSEIVIWEDEEVCKDCAEAEGYEDD